MLLCCSWPGAALGGSCPRSASCGSRTCISVWFCPALKAFLARRQTGVWLRPVLTGALSSPRCMLQRLLPFTQYEGSAVRRRGVVGTIRNCCFEHCKCRAGRRLL